jgi:hypothetical protein
MMNHCGSWRNWENALAGGTDLPVAEIPTDAENMSCAVSFMIQNHVLSVGMKRLA